MATSISDAQSFHDYAVTRIRSGAGELELDDLLMEWQHQNSQNDRFDDDVLAIKAALRDLDAGEKGTLAEDVIRELKAQFPLHENE
jgi:hypothetical protein